jgi:hypothetical protein
VLHFHYVLLQWIEFDNAPFVNPRFAPSMRSLSCRKERRAPIDEEDLKLSRLFEDRCEFKQRIGRKLMGLSGNPLFKAYPAPQENICAANRNPAGLLEQFGKGPMTAAAYWSTFSARSSADLTADAW